MPSWANKYSIEYDDWFGDTTTIYIKEREYSGSVTELTGGPEPLKILLKGDDDIFSPIKQTSAEIQVVNTTDFQILDIFTSDSKKYQVDVQKGGSTWWFGYIVGDQTTEPYVEPNYVTTLYATDGLGWLRNIPLKDDDEADLFSGYQSWDDIFAKMLITKLDMTLDLYENINIYEDNISSAAADSVLDQIFIDFDKFFEVNRDYSCWDLLAGFLKSFGAYLIQSEGAWWIIQIPENIASYTRRKWVQSAAFYVYDSNASHDPVVSTTAHDVAKASLVRLIGNTLSVQPCWRGFTIDQELGAYGQLIKGGDFPREDFDGGTNSNWTASGTPTIASIYNGIPERRSRRTTRTNDIASDDTVHDNLWVYKRTARAQVFYATRYGHRGRAGTNKIEHSQTVVRDTPLAETGMEMSVVASSPDFVYQDIVMVSTTDDMIFRVKYFATYLSVNSTVAIEIHNTTSNEHVSVSSGVVSWAAGSGTVSYTLTAGTNVSGEQEIRIPAIDDNGTIRIKLYELTCSGTAVDFVYQECYLHYLPSGVTMYNNKTINKVIDNSANYTPDAIDMYFGDAPDHDNNELCYGNAFYWDDSGTKTCTKDWDTSNVLLERVGKYIRDQHVVPQQQISGNIISKSIDWTTVIKETNNSNRKFMINRGVFDDKSGTWDVNLRQLLATKTNLITSWTNDNPAWETFTKSTVLINSAINSSGGAQAYTNNQSFSTGDMFIVRWEADAVDADGYFRIGGVDVYITTRHGARVIKTANAVSAPGWFMMDSGDTGTFTNITFYLYDY